MQFSLVGKKKARQKALKYRKSLNNSDKMLLNSRIANNLVTIKEYIEAKTIYIYVSKENEIDTLGLIEDALKSGKKVAVPKCISKTKMQFYYIDSLSQLEVGHFGVLEPCENLLVAEGTDTSFMVVPSLAVDMFGYRAGYGKGFYDRYLHNNPMPTAVLCYHKQLYFKILHNRFDYKCNYIITEKETIKRKGINNG